MKKGFPFILFSVIALMLTSLGYLIDSDPPYADFKSNVIEFTIITCVFFTLFALIYLMTKLIVKRAQKKSM